MGKKEAQCASDAKFLSQIQILSLPHKVQKLEAETPTSVKEKPEVCIDRIKDENW